MFRFLLVAIIPALVLGQTNVRQCTGGRPSPEQVRVANCTQMPCDVFRGTDHAMDVDFVAPHSANTLRPVVFATALGLTIEYPLSDDFYHACNYIINNTCPLVVGDKATYNFIFSVTAVYPPIPVTIELSLVDHMGITVFCVAIDIHVR